MSVVDSVARMMGTAPPPVPTSLHGSHADRILRTASVGSSAAAPATRATSTQLQPRGKVTLSSTVPNNAAWGGMADALVASAFILGLDTASGIWWRVNGKRLIDGSYSMWQPPGAINVFELTKFKAITAQGRNLAFWKIAGLFDTDTDWMYTAGYDDAVDQVIPLLRKKLNSEDPKNDSPQRTPPHRDTLPDKLNILNKTSCLPSSVTKVTCIIYFLLVQIPVFLVWYILAFVVYFPLSYLHRYCCGSQTAHKQLNN